MSEPEEARHVAEVEEAPPPPISLPPPAPAPLLHPVLRCALFLFAFFAIQVAAASLLAGLLDGEGIARRSPEGANEILLLAFALCLPLLLLVTRLFLAFLDRRPLASIGLCLPAGGAKAAWRQALLAPLGAAALLGLWLALLLALPDGQARFTVLGVDAGYRHPPSWWPAPPVLLLGLLLLAFTLQGWVEEWVFRGYLYRALKDRWRPWIAAAAGSAVFAFLHNRNPESSPSSFLNIFLAGMLLSGLTERTGSLWGPSLAHGTWNFAVACLLSVPVSGYSLFHLLAVRVGGDSLLTGGGFGPEGSLLLTPVAALAAAAIWRAPRRSAMPPAGPCSAGSGSP